MSVRASSSGEIRLADVRAALAVVAPRLVTLIRTIHDPQAHAVGEWTAGDVALHLVTVWDRLPALARGEMPSFLDDVWDLGEITTSLVKDATDRDPLEVARVIEGAADRFLAETADATGDEPGPWLLRGVQASLTMFACHILSECLVHGDDIARAERRPWPIEADHAAMALRGFIMCVIPKIDRRALVVQERAQGRDVCYDVSLRGGRGRFFMRIDDGELTVGNAPPRRVDCHISADPATLLLVLFGRRGPWSALGHGRVLAWGRKPWLAQTFRSLVRNP